MKKFFVVVGATVALAGCSLTPSSAQKQTSPVKENAAQTVPTQVETSPTSEMGSPSYKVESTTPVVTPAPSLAPTTTSTKAKSDEPEDLQKDLDSVSIESDFGSLVK